MSLADIKTKQEQCLNDIYTSLENKKVIIPTKKNLANVAGCIDSITAGETSYTVTFDSNGGNIIPPQKIVEGYQAKEPENPVKEGGVFGEWLLDGETFDFSTPITKDIFLTAKWLEQLINYKFIYDRDLNAGEGNICEEAGGFTTVGNSSTTGGIYRVDSNKITLNNKSCATTNSMDLSEYSVLMSIGEFRHSKGDGGESSITVGVTTTNDPKGIRADTITPNTTFTSANTEWIDCIINTDISNVHSGHPCLIGTGEGNGHYAQYYIYYWIMFKQDNWRELCRIAGLNPNDYADETALCINNEAINTILQNEKSANYMAFFCTGTFMWEFMQNENNFTLLASSPFISVISNNEHWAKFINMRRTWKGL